MSVCWLQALALQKRLNRSRCRLGYEFAGAPNRVLSGSLREMGNFWGEDISRPNVSYWEYPAWDKVNRLLAAAMRLSLAVLQQLDKSCYCTPRQTRNRLCDSVWVRDFFEYRLQLKCWTLTAKRQLRPLNWRYKLAMISPRLHNTIHHHSFSHTEDLDDSYDTIRNAILTCARKPTWVSLIYRTEPTTKKCKNRKKLKVENRHTQK